MNKKEVRNSNYELMRIISMLFIVLWHVILYGNISSNCANDGILAIFDVMLLFIIVHVNSFVLLTGYFQSGSSKIKQSKVWSILISNTFYKVVFLIIFTALGIETVTKPEIIDELLPFNVNEYWFIQVYVFLYLLIPFINKLINSLNQKEFKRLLLVLFFIFSLLPYLTGARAFLNTGYTLYHFVYLYLIGAYLRIYPLKDMDMLKRFSKEKLQIVLMIAMILCVILNYGIYKTSESLLTANSISYEYGSDLMFMTKAYCNPIVILQSICYFSLFGTFNLKNKFINKMSALTFGVYLIHENNFVRLHLYKWLKIDNGIITSYKFVIYALIISLAIYIGASIIELIRQAIGNIIKKSSIYNKVKDSYYKWYYNLIT